MDGWCSGAGEEREGEWLLLGIGFLFLSLAALELSCGMKDLQLWLLGSLVVACGI